MERFLFRVTYTDADGLTAYEPVCVRAETEAEALDEVEAATARYKTAVGSTRTVTLTLTTADE